MSASPVILVKFGGSLITDKTGREAARPEVVARLAAEVSGVVKTCDAAMILGHGSGSFGHSAATDSGWTASDSAPARRSIACTQDAAARLHRIVVSALLAAGAAPFSLAPGSLMLSKKGHLAALHAEPLFEALRAGLLPVVFGDVVLDSERRAQIYSTERVFLSLVPALLARGHTVRAYWLGDTDGVLDPSGKTIERIDPATAPAVLEQLRAGSGRGAGTVDESARRDVTGGMRHRLESALRLARLGVPSWILSGEQGRLTRAVAGEAVAGTLVEPLSG